MCCKIVGLGLSPFVTRCLRRDIITTKCIINCNLYTPCNKHEFKMLKAKINIKHHFIQTKPLIGRASGPDGIPPKLLKCALAQLVELSTLCLYRRGDRVVCPANIVSLYKGKGPKTALAWPTILTLTYDLDFQLPASCCHDLLTCEISRLTVSRLLRYSGNKLTGGRTDGRRRLHYLMHLCGILWKEFIKLFVQ